MKTTILITFTALLFTVTAQAETACQRINKSGQLISAKEFAKSTNKLFKSKGVKLRVTAKDVSTRIISFCKTEPYGTDDDISKHFIQLSDVLAATGM